jgi:hypothetical protein
MVCWARQLFLVKEGYSQRNAVTGLCTTDLLSTGNKPLSCPSRVPNDTFQIGTYQPTYSALGLDGIRRTLKTI